MTPSHSQRGGNGNGGEKGGQKRGGRRKLKEGEREREMGRGV